MSNGRWSLWADDRLHAWKTHLETQGLDCIMCTLHQDAAPIFVPIIAGGAYCACEGLALRVAWRQGALGLAYACVVPFCSTCSTLPLPVCLLAKQACSC
jgi:hypothetical protein